MAAHGRSTVAAILVAAGSGQRLGADVPKAFVLIDGLTLLEHAASRFLGHPAIGSVIVVAPAGSADHAAALTGVPAVTGGATRQDSVAAGLRALGADVRFVLVHDVARPFVPDEVIDGVLAALESGADAVVPVVPIHDTVRRVGRDGALAGVLDRSTLVAVQTPQGFRREVLTAAHDEPAEPGATDDAGLVEARGGRVVAVPGADASFKITTPSDLIRAESVARLRSAARPSIPGGTP
jgi:2-C-methyl-D-erythritol 4-phosphate cytidylyltransferase